MLTTKQNEIPAFKTVPIPFAKLIQFRTQVRDITLEQLVLRTILE